MKEISKVKKIYEGFFGEDAPQDIVDKRRLLCDACEYNSKNKQDKNTYESVRSMFTNPFCTICHCQIFEKTSSPFEECALYKIGKPKKWNKLKIETMKKNELNIYQADDLLELELKGNEFIVGMGTSSRAEFFIESKEGVKLSEARISVTCGCTTPSIRAIDTNTVKVKVGIDTGALSSGVNKKKIYFHCKLNGENVEQPIILKIFK